MIQLENFVRSQSGLYEEVTVSLNNDGMQKLRELRLWHWNQAIQNKLYAKIVLNAKYNDAYKSYNNLANINMKFVQTLNSFFPVDDTAEKDAMK